MLFLHSFTFIYIGNKKVCYLNPQSFFNDCYLKKLFQISNSEVEKYSNLSDNYHFVSVGVETYGTYGHQASQTDRQKLSTFFLFQSISMAIQRDNAVTSSGLDGLFNFQVCTWSWRAMIKNIYTYMYLISFLLPLKSINVSGCTSIKKSLKFEVWIYFFEERLLQVAFTQKKLIKHQLAAVLRRLY